MGTNTPDTHNTPKFISPSVFSLCSLHTLMFALCGSRSWHCRLALSNISRWIGFHIVLNFPYPAILVTVSLIHSPRTRRRPFPFLPLPAPPAAPRPRSSAARPPGHREAPGSRQMGQNSGLGSGGSDRDRSVPVDCTLLFAMIQPFCGWKM